MKAATMDKNKEIKRSFLSTGLQIRSKEDGSESRTITGYAILFNSASAPFWEDDDEVMREMIDPSAVTRDLLDKCDIKMTMFHDNKMILARSKEGNGTLSYNVDEKGVSFEFEAPNTVDGDKALELVRRGDLAGCSFAFRTHYYDDAYVSREVVRKDGKTNITNHVKLITGIYDFTLTSDPAYPETSCEAREFAESLREKKDPEKELSQTAKAQIAEMELNSKFNL